MPGGSGDHSERRGDRRPSSGFCGGSGIIHKNPGYLLGGERRLSFWIAPDLWRLAFHANVNRVVRFVAKVLDLMLERRKPSGLAGLRVNFRDFSVLIGEPQMSSADH